MAIPIFTPVENYDAFKILKESQLNALAASVKTQFDTYTKLNFEQLALDVFGVTYVYNNDGLQTLVTPLIDILAALADNETVTGSWTFSNSVAFNSTVSGAAVYSSSGQPRGKAYIGANQAIVDSLVSAINHNLEAYDVGAMHDIVQPSRLSVPVGASGIYSIHGQATFVASAVGRRELQLFKNGSKIAEVKEFGPDAAQQTVLQVAAHDTAAAGDFYEIKVFQSSGAPLDVVLGERVTFISAMKVW